MTCVVTGGYKRTNNVITVNSSLIVLGVTIRSPFIHSNRDEAENGLSDEVISNNPIKKSSRIQKWLGVIPV